MEKKKELITSLIVISATVALGGVVYSMNKDEIAPELKGIKNLTVDVADKSEFNPLKGVSAEDNKDGDITKSIKLSDLDIKKAGKQSLTYTIEDKKGNKSEKTITITVTDRVAEEKKKAEEARLKAEAEAKAKAAEEARVLAEQQAQAEAEAQRQAQSQASSVGGSQSSGGGGYSSNSSSGGGSSYIPPAQSSGGGNSGGSSYTPPASEEPTFDISGVGIGGQGSCGDMQL